jgi:hypothetical protein
VSISFVEATSAPGLSLVQTVCLQTTFRITEMGGPGLLGLVVSMKQITCRIYQKNIALNNEI